MGLLTTLQKKRDHHLALARKFIELIAVLQGDPDLQKIGAKQQRTIVNGARAKYAQLAAVAAEPPKPRKKRTMTPAQRKAAGDRMRKMVKDRWKRHRAEMLKVAQRGGKKAGAGLKRRAAAKRAILAQTPAAAGAAAPAIP